MSPGKSFFNMICSLEHPKTYFKRTKNKNFEFGKPGLEPEPENLNFEARARKVRPEPEPENLDFEARARARYMSIGFRI